MNDQNLDDKILEAVDNISIHGKAGWIALLLMAAAIGWPIILSVFDIPISNGGFCCPSIALALFAVPFFVIDSPKRLL